MGAFQSNQIAAFNNSGPVSGQLEGLNASAVQGLAVLSHPFLSVR